MVCKFFQISAIPCWDNFAPRFFLDIAHQRYSHCSSPVEVAPFYKIIRYAINKAFTIKPLFKVFAMTVRVSRMVDALVKC